MYIFNIHAVYTHIVRPPYLYAKTYPPIICTGKLCYGQVEISLDGSWTSKKWRRKKIFKINCQINYQLYLDNLSKCM